MTVLPATHAAHLVTDLPAAFLAHGADTAGDVDGAFDDAVEQAGYDHGFAGLVPSVASISADEVTVASLEPVTLQRALLLAGRALRSGALEPGHAYALPICPDSTYKRRRVRVTLADPALEVAENAGPLTHVPGRLEDLLRRAASDAGAPVPDDELLESVTITTARHRYKPVATPFKGGSAAEHVVLDPSTGTIVSAGHRTAGEARRAAVDFAKQGPVGGSATGHLEVVKVTRRADGNPLVRVDRTRVASRLAVKLTTGTVKNPAKVKTTGWLFYGFTTTTDAGDPGDPGTDDNSRSAGALCAQTPDAD